MALDQAANQVANGYHCITCDAVRYSKIELVTSASEASAMVNPHSLMCGHIFSANALKVTRPPIIRTSALICTSCDRHSAVAIPNYTLGTDESFENGYRPGYIHQTITELRMQRRAVYESVSLSMRVFVQTLINESFRSGTMSLSDAYTAVPFEKMRDIGIVQNASDLIIYMTYRDGTYKKSFLASDGIEIHLHVSRNSDASGTCLISNHEPYADFVKRSENYFICLSYTFNDGYDGEMD